MHLVPRELDKLIISQAGFLAQRRLARGLRLNQVEAMALIANNIQELIRDGTHSVSVLRNAGKQMLGRRHVLPSVEKVLCEIQVEGTFPDGTYLVTIHDPISSDDGDITKALYGSFLPIPDESLFPPTIVTGEYNLENQPGAIVTVEGKLDLNKGRRRRILKITNKGDRPVQIGSHYHMIEVNPLLEFDRIQAYGFRLDITAGTAVRFEPGDSRTVTLVEIGGDRIIQGGNKIASGVVDAGRVEEILNNLAKMGFAHITCPPIQREIIPATIDRSAYAAMFGPTTGDLVRLGDTELWVKVEKDYTVYGDECRFGGGRSIREGMGQASGRADNQTVDLIITNALIIDYTGIYKADIGVKNGAIVGIGKSGNPDVMDGVDKALVIGSNTDVIAGEGKIITYGGFDSHIHFICPQQANEALSSGITTMLGGGTGPSAGTSATTCTPGANYIRQMLQAIDTLPLNYGVTGKGNDCFPQGLRDQCVAGVVGLKLHEDWGTTPAAIDNCLSVCDKYDIQCLIHTDTLNESGFVEQTVGAFKGRTIHTYHTEGAGGGHSPDIISVVQHKNVLPSSTNPTLPFTSNTIEEHKAMLMVCHHLRRDNLEDCAFADSRIRKETIAAEDVLHDIGAVSMVSSDSQAMGRCGEVITRTWQTASKNKIQRGPLPEDVDTGADNFRVRRYVAKYTVNPAIAHGMSHLIGSIEIGKLADLVLWDPAQFGAKPSLVLKSGLIAYSQMGDSNASIPCVQPIIGRQMFAPLVPTTSITFVSAASLESGTVQSYGLKKRVEAVRGCRNIGKKHMKLNDAMPSMRVDPETYNVEADGKSCTSDEVDKLPLTQGYYLF